MGEYRKPRMHETSRRESPSLDADSLPFSIETTTMRLKSLKLRRAEAAERELHRGQGERRATQPSHDLDFHNDQDRPAGRVRHDERGVAVWDWAVASGEFATLSATNMLQKLDLDALSIEETQRGMKQMQPQGRDAGGGGDPYNTRGAGKRTGEAAKRQGITGAADRPRSSVLDQLTGKKK